MTRRAAGPKHRLRLATTAVADRFPWVVLFTSAAGLVAVFVVLVAALRWWS